MARSGAGGALVVIAYDGSRAARQAVVDAAKILGPCQILVVTVWEEGLANAPLLSAPSDGLTSAPIVVDPEVSLEVDRRVHEQAERVAREGAALVKSLGLDAQPLALRDERLPGVASTILTLARERQAAAIVVGSRGLSGIRARLEGSTSKALLKHAPCPVIVVHEVEKRGEDD